MGIVVRDNYLAALGWELVRLDDGGHKLQRTATLTVQSHLQPMNGLGLFMNCLNDGLPIANPLPIIAQLSGLANDVICVNTQLGDAARSTNTMEGFRQFAKNHPHLAIVHQLPDISEPAANEPFLMVQDDDPELDAMLDRIFHGEGQGDLGSQAGYESQFFAMGMGNSTTGFN